MYREKWVEEILSGRSVLTLALDVHMTVNGSTDRDPIKQERDILALREIEHAWKNEGICDFDDAVLALVRAAITEAGYATIKETYRTPDTPAQQKGRDG